MTRGSQPITGHGWQASIDGSKVVLAALPMVAVVNILVGAIVAFVGALQLRPLGGPEQLHYGCASVASMAARMAGSSGGVSGAKRPMTLPWRSTRNFSKFHSTSL
jgi:hypothetical protein